MLPLHIAWCFLLVDYCEMGIRGTALASSITSFTGFISLTVYTSRFTDDQLRNETWYIPSTKKQWMEVLDKQGLTEYTIFGISSMGTICLEWWSFEIMMLLSSYISVKATAT
jgi:Na+-driven multidrug efflux pump